MHIIMTNFVKIFPKLTQRYQKCTTMAQNGQNLKYFPHYWSQWIQTGNSNFLIYVSQAVFLQIECIGHQLYNLWRTFELQKTFSWKPQVNISKSLKFLWSMCKSNRRHLNYIWTPKYYHWQILMLWVWFKCFHLN